MKIGLIIVVTNMLNMLNMINIVQPTWKFDGISLILIYVDGSSWTLMASKCFNHQNPSKSIKIYENPLFHGVNFFSKTSNLQKYQQLLELLQKLSLQVTRARTATAQRDKRGMERSQAMVPCCEGGKFKVKIW
jgi:hypothetical protein